MAVPIFETDEIAKRELHFFWITDTSGSMAGQKIASLNQAIRDVLPEIRNVLKNEPQCELQMRAIAFDSDARWHVGPQPVRLDDFRWVDLVEGGTTRTGLALNMLCDALERDVMPKRCFQPVCILMSDGFATDPAEYYQAAIDRLNSLFWGQQAIRIPIAIGREDQYDEAELAKFSNKNDLGVLKATSTAQLTSMIQFVSVGSVTTASGNPGDTSALNLDAMQMPGGGDMEDDLIVD